MENKVFFIFSDIHGRKLERLNRVLIKAGFDENNENHILVSLGDLFDRGHHNLDLLRFVNHYLKKDRAIVLWGNHELMLKTLYNKELSVGIKINKFDGLNTTLAEFIKANNPDVKEEALLDFENTCLVNEEIKTLIMNLRNFDELDFYMTNLLPYKDLNGYLLSHTGVTECLDYEKYDRMQLTIELFSVLLAQRQSNNLFTGHSFVKYPPRFDKHGRTKVIHGHTHVNAYSDSNINVFIDKNHICLDSEHSINVLKMIGERIEVFQELYE